MRTGLKAVKPFASTRSILVLGYVRLCANSIAATDTEAWGEYALNGTGDDTVLLPAKGLTDALDAHSGERVTIEEGDGRATVGRMTLITLPAADYPLGMDFNADGTTEMPDFAVALPPVLIAYSRDETRPVLTAVRFERKGKACHLVATDSYRLHVQPIRVKGDPLPSMNIPGDTLKRLLQYKSKEPTLVSLDTKQGRARFTVGPLTVYTRTVDGQYPQYKQLVPDTFPIGMTCDRAPFVAALKAAGKMADKNAPVRLRISPDSVTLATKSQDRGDYTSEPIPATVEGDEYTVMVGWSGDNKETYRLADNPLEIGFNPGFLLDGVNATTGPLVTLHLINPLRPGMVGDSAGFALVMPIRLFD